ncbi:MAG: translation initiation factor IF-2 [Candidatus Omnitrophica bacterium]|nr:translation initiation factor IF-2 [Candidatus Omnitrophota bacterium]
MKVSKTGKTKSDKPKKVKAAKVTPAAKKVKAPKTEPKSKKLSETKKPKEKPAVHVELVKERVKAPEEKLQKQVLPKVTPVKPAVKAAPIASPKPIKRTPSVGLPVVEKLQKKEALKPISKPEASPKPTQEVKPKAPATLLPAAPKAPEAIRIRIPITVGAFADILKVKPAELIKNLIAIGVFANINQLLNEEVTYKLSAKLGIKIEKIEDEVEKIFEGNRKEDRSLLKSRAPVVTMMGHVDHGKTSLLDAIRQTNVASGEAGHITQHIGAYMVDLPGKGRVTFLDTPGHEAFTAIRARGANVTDIVVLVVAADDGVMPQTLEAIDHAKAAGCPIVVAVNKSDLPAANPQRVMTQLQKLGLVAEEWGGKTIFAKVSAKTGDGIDALLEMLLLEAEVLELRANPDCEAQGTVLEAKLTKGHGAVSTALVQRGTLRIGDIVVAGPYCGRIRAMRNDRGKAVKEAGLSYAVEIHGLSGVPDAGELFTVVKDEKIARQLAEKRELEIREHAMKGLHTKHLSLQELHSRMQAGQVQELNLILKADAQGSLEGLVQTLTKSVSDKISIRVIHGGIGGVNESDVMLAIASDAIIIGFHVKAEPRAQELIEKEGIDARYYSIIYEAVEDVRKAMEGLLEPTNKEVVEGRIEIRQVFKSSKVGTIGGAIVTKGRVMRTSRIRVIRDNIVVHEGKLASLRRFKDDVREVQEGYECGVAVDGFSDLKERDILEAYRIDKVATKLA